jgi:hypothetical protein
MVALAIVAIVLVPLLRLHLLSLDATVRAQDLTTAVLLAQGQMATIMGKFPDPGEEEGTYDDPELARYRWQTAVAEHTLDVGEDTNVEVRHIEVTVRWTDGQSERHYTLETYVSRAPQ